MSTTTPDWIGEATSLLSAASGPAGAVTATSNLLTEILKVAEPFISNEETQSYENAKKQRIQEALDILSKVDAVNRPQQLGDYMSKLLLDAGSPIAGGVPGDPLLGIRVSVLLAFITVACGKICDDAYLTSLTQAAAKGQPPAK